MKLKLQNFDPERFLRNYWQAKPCFVKNALPADFLKLTPAALFNLAQRDEVESRLIARKKVQGRWRYTANDGPFDRAQLAAHKSRADWTLLVQRVNEWLPHVDLLFEYFAFIANWRIDDIMISYAAPGGTVGPHLDNYDVFLCQLQGNRTWQYSNRGYKTENLEPNQPVRLLTDFKADHEVVAHPGDILYIPPRYAHYGIAESDSITVSVGFRAPQVGRLVDILFGEMTSQNSDIFFTDKRAAMAKNPGEFNRQSLEKLFALAQAGLSAVSRSSKLEAVGDALLRDLSASPNSQIRSRTTLSLGEFKARWRKHPLQRNPRNRYFFDAARGSLTLYAAGESFVLPSRLRPAVAQFCNARVFTPTLAWLKPPSLAFWYEMYALGFVFFQK